MWAPRTGLRHRPCTESAEEPNSPRRPTDAEWALAEPLIPPAKRGGRRRSVEVREVLNGLFSVLSTGCQWRALPKDRPPRSTAHEYLQLWDWDGTLARIHYALSVQTRDLAGKEASPTVAIIDGQSVKGAEKGAPASARAATVRARRSRARSATSWSTRSAWSSPLTSTRRASRTGTGPCRC
jgi:transposase